MSEFKGTPGPWSVIDGVRVHAALGADSGDGAPADSTDGWCIADVSSVPDTSYLGTPTQLGYEVMRANARLIAAAPDHAMVCRVLCAGIAYWRSWGDRKGEFCMDGLCYATQLDDFGCPVVTNGMRVAIAKAGYA
ncbi:hypothetical protein ARC78_14980 [Stenotrophomonas pictorum JCM 9942]|uniref:Uncharacterized protein n=1 Tax=Stenotrophomonas pictorum JCM 9942 TaxID=1236960 RepID=A0A0R0A1J8_9GAMM|nr:hypothetical protein [Stenotrophomonas pictorum]KRG39120.1 hypothetical protein ARC78_14980 [Stenotrophomonas pictorum JCM 9942]